MIRCVTGNDLMFDFAVRLAQTYHVTGVLATGRFRKRFRTCRRTTSCCGRGIGSARALRVQERARGTRIMPDHPLGHRQPDRIQGAS